MLAFGPDPSVQTPRIRFPNLSSFRSSMTSPFSSSSIFPVRDEQNVKMLSKNSPRSKFFIRILSKGMPYNVGAYDVAGLGGLSNDDRNGKADPLNLSHVTKRYLKT